jgi:hypothetical protein
MARRANGLDQIVVAELERLRQNEKQLTTTILQLFQERDALVLALYLMSRRSVVNPYKETLT